MKVDLDAIEQVALAAKKCTTDRNFNWSSWDVGYVNPTAIADHLETCSPDVVLVLVARIRELEQKLEPSRLQGLLEMRLLDSSDFPYAASKEGIAEVVEAIVFSTDPKEKQ